MATKPLIPNQFLFRFSVPCRFRAKFARGAGRLVDLPSEMKLPFLGSMDGQPEFAEIRIAWNDSGLALQWEISGKEQAIYGEPDRPTACDGLSLWLDMRDTRTIHRATRYCQRLTFLVHDGAEAGAAGVWQKPINRALEDCPAADLSQIKIARTALDEEGEDFVPKKGQLIKSYRMEVVIPASQLSGFDPETNRRLGYCYRLRDREMGDQLSAAGPEFPYWEDPSLWSVLELVK